MRGAPCTCRRTRFSERIIPADAGSTGSHSSPYCSWWDHPRGCGEHHIAVFMYCFDSGSSPRMRGTLVSAPSPLSCGRIIPADAGSTCLASGAGVIFEDHPRGCGEHGSMCMREYLSTGSSPRMRGALGRQDGIGRVEGIIPADAGSTLT